MPLGSKSASGSGAGRIPHPKIWGIDSRQIIKALYWLTVAIAVCFAYLNIQPYAVAVKSVMVGASDPALIRFIAAIPIVNGLAATSGLVLHWAVGLLLWLVIQTIEVFPIVLKRDRAFLRVLIGEAESSSKFEEREDDEPTLAALKRWYNRFPTLTMSSARTAALFVYALDFLICLTVYPPCKGGFGNFIFLLATGQYSRLDWRNIALLLITLYAIEAIVRFLFWLGQIAYFMKSAHAQQ